MSANPDLVNEVVALALQTPLLQRMTQFLDAHDRKQAAAKLPSKRDAHAAPTVGSVKLPLDDTHVDPEILAEEVKQLCQLATDAGEVVSYQQGRDLILTRRAGGARSKFDRPAAREYATDDTARYSYATIAQQEAADASLRRSQRAVQLCERATMRGERLGYGTAIEQAIEEGL